MIKAMMAAAGCFLFPVAVAADVAAGVTPGGITLQPAHSGIARDVHFFHNGVLMPVIVFICLFVLALLAWVVFRYNSRANPSPRKFSHNTAIEVVWTVIPVLILLLVALPSFELLFNEDIVPDGRQTVSVADGVTDEFVFPNDFPQSRMVTGARHLEVLLAGVSPDGATPVRRLRHGQDYHAEGFGKPDIRVRLEEMPRPGEQVIIRGGRSAMNAADCGYFSRYFDLCEKEIVLAPTVTLKVNGYQWNWQYSYPDFGNFSFFSNMLPEDATDPSLYRFEVDNRVVVPVGETIRVLTTANDVIHSWAVPAFALKMDAVPGRINETWFRADRVGVYYGQCSEICGIRHAFMPVAVEVVTRPEFDAWVDEQRRFAGLEPLAATGGETPAQVTAVVSAALD